MRECLFVHPCATPLSWYSGDIGFEVASSKLLQNGGSIQLLKQEQFMVEEMAGWRMLDLRVACMAGKLGHGQTRPAKMP
jgi:hypothetical protein